MLKIYFKEVGKSIPGKQIGIVQGNFQDNKSYELINSFLEGKNIQSYYCRMWFVEHKGKIYQKVDYGSHVSFFYLEEVFDDE